MSSVSGSFYDLNQVADLKYGESSTEKARLEKAAKEFETLFVNELLKTARKAEQALSEDSPFNSEETKTFQGMLDQEFALALGRQGTMGIAQMLVQQLSQRQDQAVKGEMIMPERNLSLRAPKAIDRASVQGLDLSQLDSRQARFVNTVALHAKSAAEKLGVPVSHIVAQAALESGWGEHVPQTDSGSSHNLFGIKTGTQWQGEQSVKHTQEFIAGRWVTERASFRAYPSLTEGLNDYAEFIQKPRYAQAIGNPEGYFEALQAGGYATDPDYAEKARRVLTQVQSLLAVTADSKETDA